MEINSLDFSQFHPLDHRIGTARCKEFYGGWRTHYKYWRTFKAEDDLVAPIAKRTLCRIGRHKMRPMWDGKDFPGRPPDTKTDQPSGYWCAWCPRRTKTNDKER